MRNKTISRRISASFIRSIGKWEVDTRRKGVLIIERDEIVQPLFSPLWLLATLLTIYIAHITLIINERGWKGAFILIAPALFIIWLAISKHKPVIEPERLEFNSTEESLTITESDGKIKRAHTLKYQDIEALAFHPHAYLNKLVPRTSLLSDQ